MTFDTPLQTLVSFAALVVWSYWVIRPPKRNGVEMDRWPFVVVWSVTLLLAVASLTYVDLIPSDTTRAIQFSARLFLLICGLGVPIVAAGRHIRGRE